MDDVSSGASSDIQQVTRLARAMILEWGMSPRLGFVNYHGQDDATGYIPDKDYSDETARIIDEETKRLVDEAYTHAESMLTDNWDKVEAVAQALLKYENLTADEVHSIMRGEPIGRSTVAELLAAEPPNPTSTNGNDSGPKKSESTDTDTPPDTLPSPA
jgi:cell division protease FtsH